MKQIILTLLTGLMTLTSYAQKKKDLVVSVAAGALTSPYYRENKSGRFYNIDFDYYLSTRQILSVNYNNGRHKYYDNLLSSLPVYIIPESTNAKAGYATFSILYKYRVFNKRAFSGVMGTGIGNMTHTRTYPYKTNTGSSFTESSWTYLVFPVRLEFDYKISTTFRLGLVGGFYIAPDYPILAYYVGPRLGYLLK